MEDKRCAVCGNDKNLKFYINATIKTRGYDVTFPKSYICNKCENRIRKPKDD